MDFQEILTSLKDSNKVKRRKTLEKINSSAFYGEDCININETGKDLWKNHSTALISTIYDESEVNRTQGSEIVCRFIEKEGISSDCCSIIVPCIANRISEDLVENSEEVRLLYVRIISQIIKFQKEEAIFYLNDYINILKISVMDKSPEVRICSCDCVSSLAFETKKKFHMQSGSLVKPLLNSLCFQRFKNRVAALEALGMIYDLHIFFLIRAEWLKKA